jgi:hypothetical protein
LHAAIVLRKGLAKAALECVACGTPHPDDSVRGLYPCLQEECHFVLENCTPAIVAAVVREVRVGAW